MVECYNEVMSLEKPVPSGRVASRFFWTIYINFFFVQDESDGAVITNLLNRKVCYSDSYILKLLFTTKAVTIIFWLILTWFCDLESSLF